MKSTDWNKITEEGDTVELNGRPYRVERINDCRMLIDPIGTRLMAKTKKNKKDGEPEDAEQGAGAKSLNIWDKKISISNQSNLKIIKKGVLRGTVI